jgi:hypothetical protein
MYFSKLAVLSALTLAIGSEALLTNPLQTGNKATTNG